MVRDIISFALLGALFLLSSLFAVKAFAEEVPPTEDCNPTYQSCEDPDLKALWMD